MRNLKHVFFIVGLEAVLLLLSYGYTENPGAFRWEIPRADTLQLAFPKLDKFFVQKNKNKQDTTNLLRLLDSLPELTVVKPKEAPKPKINFFFEVDSALRITNPYNPATNTYALDAFFYKLSRLQEENKPVHIAFYGDSQIEGDRITRLFRHYLQQEFGGSGLGFIPFLTPATNFSIRKLEPQGTWIRKSIFLKSRKYSNKYGVSGNMYYFVENDSVEVPSIELQLREFIQYDSLFLLLGNLKTPLVLQVKNAFDTLIYRDTLPPTRDFIKYAVNIPDAYKRHFKMEFIATQSPEFYGFVLDGKQGIQVDNYGIRGHGGQGWKKADRNFIAKQLKAFNTKLIILEYGGNAVPYESENFQWFGYELEKTILFFKKALPGMPILVIGVGDMAKASPEGVSSYESIDKIRKVQKAVALKHHCAFWDLYQVMGGENSIIEWVDKGLAARDYAHFSYGGQKLIAKLLYQALMFEYQEYLKRTLP